MSRLAALAWGNCVLSGVVRDRDEIEQAIFAVPVVEARSRTQAGAIARKSSADMFSAGDISLILRPNV